MVKASRGETVLAEILGSGDASATNQSFKLKKNPVTYTPSATAGNETGVASTLKVYVGGVRWTEVPTFYDAASDAQIYIVRQNDDGESIVTFGDGVRGSRLLTDPTMFWPCIASALAKPVRRQALFINSASR